MTSPTYPHLSRANDLVYCALYRAGGRTLSPEEIHAAHKPGIKWAAMRTNGRALIARLRKDFAECGHEDFIETVHGAGFRLDMSKAPPYRHQIDRAADLGHARRPLTIIPLPDRAADLDPTCWLSNRFLRGGVMETFVLIGLWLQAVVYGWFVPMYSLRQKPLQAVASSVFCATSLGAISLINGWV